MEAIHGAGAFALQWRLRSSAQGRVLRLGQGRRVSRDVLGTEVFL